MHLLALPKDEQQIIRHLCEQEGLQLLLADLLQEGSPRVAADPLAALAPSLPSWKRLRAAVTPGVGVTDPTYQEVWKYLLWANSLGPIRTLDDAPAARDAVDRVALQLNREATEQWRDLIDLTRTPVIGLRRTSCPQPRTCIVGATDAAPDIIATGRRETASKRTHNWLYAIGRGSDLSIVRFGECAM